MLSFTASYATYTFEEEDEDPITADGTTLQVEYERGVTDSMWLRGTAGGGIYWGDERSYAGFGAVGITYQLDILKYVPYLNAGVSGFYVTDVGFKPNLELGIGLDILQSRKLSYGVTFRFDYFASTLLYLTAGVRVSWRWGYF